MFRLISYVDRKSSEVGQAASKFRSLQSCCNMWIAEREKKGGGGGGGGKYAMYYNCPG